MSWQPFSAENQALSEKSDQFAAESRKRPIWPLDHDCFFLSLLSVHLQIVFPPERAVELLICWGTKKINRAIKLVPKFLLQRHSFQDLRRFDRGSIPTSGMSFLKLPYSPVLSYLGACEDLNPQTYNYRDEINPMDTF